MPELPEVETIRRGLIERLIGRKIDSIKILKPSVIIGNPDQFKSDLTGQTLKSILRHGKKMIWDFGPYLLTSHLRMTGQLVFCSPHEKIDAYTRLVFKFHGIREALRFIDIRRFGRWQLFRAGQNMDLKGVDAFLASEDSLQSALKKRKGMIKAALLDQSVLAGLGNIYVDEALYQSKIHPRKRLEMLSKEKIVDLCKSIKSILHSAIKIKGTTFRNYVNTNGETGGYRKWLVVYGKQGTPCSCGAVIQKIVLAGRGTHYCPRCQN